MEHYHIAWWNLENLFDTQDSQLRPDWLQKELKKELKEWNQEILDCKIKQLSKIILKMNQERGPDILGVCEIENEHVLDLLIGSLSHSGQNYSVAHHDTSDGRGIDVAFIYDSDKFESEGQYFHVVLKRTATRDLFQVNLKNFSWKCVDSYWKSLAFQEGRYYAFRTISHYCSRNSELQEQKNFRKKGRKLFNCCYGRFQ